MLLLLLPLLLLLLLLPTGKAGRVAIEVDFPHLVFLQLFFASGTGYPYEKHLR
jgi:hypothetical protein